MMRLVSLAHAALFGALLLAAPAAVAQDNSTVGSPLLRDFELNGRRTTPPPAEQQAPPPPAQPKAEEPVTSRPAAEGPAPRPTEQRASPATRPQPQPQPQAPVSEPVQSPVLTPAPETAPAFDEPLTEALPPPPPPFATGTAPAPLAQEQDGSGSSIPWLVLAAALVLGGAAFLFFKRRKAELAYEAAPGPMPAAAPPPPAPAPAVPAGTLQVDLRPWLDIEFRPDRVVATDADATVHFELIVKNRGRSPARNVRIQARMFNPSANQKQEISAFFATPFDQSGEPIVIPPQLAARFKTKVVMPRESVREVQVQGKSIFVPTVAVNIVYDYGTGRTGQTCNSYVVGTETQASEKMGPFRLDLGPRIYRHVGGRSMDLARAV